MGWLRRAAAFGSIAMLASCTLFTDFGDFHEVEPSSPEAGAGSDATGDVSSDGEAGPPTCIADFAVNPKHCGACGRDCRGGQCVLGKCQPHLLASLSGFGWYMTIDESALYVIVREKTATTTGSAATIVRVDKPTGVTTEL